MSRRLQPDRIRFVCLAVIGTSSVLLVIAFLTSEGHRTAVGPNLGVDFAGFYTAGALLNEYPSHRLYDFTLQDELYHRLLPGLPPAERLPYVYPPFLTLLFRPLALLPYAWAYLVWLAFSVAVSLSGLLLILKTCNAIPRTERPIILLLAMSFEPLILECWFGGQTSALALFAMAVALYCEQLRFAPGIGLALALCLYKPTLLLLIIPLLAVARRWHVLAWFGLGAIGLAGLSLLVVGGHGCIAYAKLVGEFAEYGNRGMPEFPTWKFVDLKAFFILLFGGRSSSLPLLSLAYVLSGIALLARPWWGLDRLPPDQRKLIWAATLTWTLVFNVYIGTYDTVIVLLGILLTADVLCQRRGDKWLASDFKTLLFFLYCFPWFSQFLARTIGFQPYTLLLIAIGFFQVALAHRMTHQDVLLGGVESSDLAGKNSRAG